MFCFCVSFLPLISSSHKVRRESEAKTFHSVAESQIRQTHQEAVEARQRERKEAATYERQLDGEVRRRRHLVAAAAHKVQEGLCFERLEKIFSVNRGT